MVLRFATQKAGLSPHLLCVEDAFPFTWTFPRGRRHRRLWVGTYTGADNAELYLRGSSLAVELCKPENMCIAGLTKMAFLRLGLPQGPKPCRGLWASEPGRVSRATLEMLRVCRPRAVQCITDMHIRRESTAYSRHQGVHELYHARW